MAESVVPADGVPPFPRAGGSGQEVLTRAPDLPHAPRDGVSDLPPLPRAGEGGGEGPDIGTDEGDESVYVVEAPDAGLRLDRFLALRRPDVSRSRLQRWIEGGAATRNGAPARARDAVRAGDTVALAEVVDPEDSAYAPEAMPIPVVWEDDSILVLDKPAGLVVHPGAGNWSGTLLNGLLAYDPALARVPRAGIVHRLDAGTSGLMVVARTIAAQTDLVRQLQERTVLREYWAVVAGETPPSGTIDAALARDPRNPLRFRVSESAHARPARTRFRRIRTWTVGSAGTRVSWVACRLETGRTHQIRVHMESIGHPLLGDPVYRRHLPATLNGQSWLGHQALHARRLALVHPRRRETMEWFAPPPPDLHELMRSLGATEEELVAPPLPPDLR